MNCGICGEEMTKITTNLPFRLPNKFIAIMKNLPVIQCQHCGEYLIEDKVMKRLENVFENISPTVELEVYSYAA